MDTFIKEEEEEEDIKDFPLFNSSNVDYYTFDIVSGAHTDNGNNGKVFDTLINVPQDLSQIKVEVNEDFSNENQTCSHLNTETAIFTGKTCFTLNTFS